MNKREAQEWIEINPEKLREEIKARNLTVTGIGNDLGLGWSLKNALNKGRLQKPIVLLLEAVYGITKDSIIREEKHNTVPVAEEDERAKNIMVAAFTEVLRSEEAKTLLLNIIKYAVDDALKA